MAAPDVVALGRLSFRVPAERMAEFETAYRGKVVPFLETQGLDEQLALRGESSFVHMLLRQT